MTAWRRVQKSLRRVVVGEVVFLPCPPGVRVILLDGKHVRFAHRPWTFYAAIDGHTGQPLGWILLPRSELRAGYDALLMHLASEGVTPLAFVSDWHIGIRAAVAAHFPNAVHQRCAAHVLQDVLRKLGGVRFLSTTIGRTHWQAVRSLALSYGNVDRARERLIVLQEQFPSLHRGLRVLRRMLPDIYQFAIKKQVNIPRTSNRIENFMGFLEQRLKTMRGVKVPENYITLISQLIFLKWKKSKRPTNK